MPVAKSYMSWELLTNPFMRRGRMYVTVKGPDGTQKDVRWYRNDEWKQMYPDLAYMVTGEKPDLREMLGFGEEGFITVYCGNTYANLSWFKAADQCRYHKVFGWYTPSKEQIPEDIPEGVKVCTLKWDDIVDENGEISETKVKEITDSFNYEPSNSTFVGTIGDRDEFELTVKRTVDFQNRYGISTMHIMEDPDGNVFVWTTASQKLDTGTTYAIRGTIKDHRTYKNVDQTILSRCKILETYGEEEE